MNLHHANIFVGDGSIDLSAFLYESIEFVADKNPDYRTVETDSFGIGDARDLEEWAIGKPIAGSQKVLFIIANSITFEAQNALLKIFEEPGEGTYFFLKMPHLGNVLPTLLSRVRILETPKNIGSKGSKEEVAAQKFMSNDADLKLSHIRSLSKKEDKSSMKNFLGALEKEYYATKFKNSMKNAGDMRRILLAKKMASIRGGSPRVVLEWLATML